jgi:uncharacterized protein (TIRG00374 family)
MLSKLTKNNMKKQLFLTIRIAVAVGLLAYLSTNIDLLQFWDQVRNARFHFVLFSFALFFIIAVLSVLRWKLLLGVYDVKPSFYALGKLFFIGLFFNNAMPGLTGGDIIKAYYVTKETTHSKPETIISLLMDRIVGMVALLTMGTISLLFNLQNQALQKITLVIIAILMSIIIFIPIFFQKNMLTRIPVVTKLLGILPFSEMLVRIYNAFYEYKSHSGILVSGLILSLFIQGINIVMIFFLGLSISLHSVRLIHYFLFIPIITVITAIPISIAGLGVSEQLFIYFFGLIGANKESALAIAIMGRLIVLMWSLLGLFYYITAKGTKTSGEIMEKEIKALANRE